MMKHWATTALMVAGLGVTALAAPPAGAHGGGPRGGGFGEGGAGRPTRSSGLLRQLVFPCPAECRTTARECNEAADVEAQTCIAGACTTEVEAARTACAEDSEAAACRDAIAVLRTCAGDCLDARGTTITACREALSDCVDTCEGAESAE